MSEKLFGSLQTLPKSPGYSGTIGDEIEVHVDNKERTIGAQLSSTLKSIFSDSKAQLQNLQEALSYHSSQVKQIENDIMRLEIVTLQKINEITQNINDFKEDVSSDYLLKKDLPQNVSQFNNDSHYASETFVKSEIAKAQLDEKEVDLSAYYTKDETYSRNELYTKDQLYTKEDLYTKQEVDSQIETIEQDIETSLEEYVPTDAFNSTLGNYYTKNTIDTRLTDYATQSYVRTEIAKAQIGGEDVDLSDYYTKEQTLSKEEIESTYTPLVTTQQLQAHIAANYLLKSEKPIRVSQLENDSSYLTSETLPDFLVTEEELEAKGYLTEHQSLSNYVTQDDLASASKDIEDKIPDTSQFITMGQMLAQNYLTVSNIPSEYITSFELRDELDPYITEQEVTNILTSYDTSETVDDKIKTVDIRKDFLDMSALLNNNLTQLKLEVRNLDEDVQVLNQIDLIDPNTLPLT